MIRALVIGVFVLSAMVGGVAACGDDGDSGATAPSSESTQPSPSTFRMEGASMEPTLLDGAVVEVIPYGDTSPERGDIVVFRPPLSIDREFLKRIIGLPGDTVEIDETSDEVRVNGTPLVEPYARTPTVCFADCSLTIPEAETTESESACGSRACYFVLGDNRQNSSDSRQGWLVPAENVIGWVHRD